MLLGGLWHGAHLRFVFWGFYHGLLLLIERLFVRRSGGGDDVSIWRLFLGRIITFHLVLIGWLLFRAETPGVALDMVTQVFSHFGGQIALQYIMSNSLIIGLMLGSFMLIGMPARIKELIRGWFIVRSYWIKILIVLVVLFLIYQFQISELKPFIYFRF